MKPKTKLQHRVAVLSTGLQPITAHQRDYAVRHCFVHLAFLRKSGEAVCLECGNRWKVSSKGNVVCPHCGSKVKLQATKKLVYSDAAYFMVMTTESEFQVLRYFFCEQECRAGRQASYRTDEVCQVWMDSRGRMVVMSIARRIMSMYCDDWILGTEMEVRRTRCRTTYWYDIDPLVVYPYKRILPELKRNGFSGEFHDIRPVPLLRGLLSESCIETLFKAGQYPLVSFFAGSSQIARYWESIRICLRNGYLVSDVSLWRDMIEMLYFLGKDARNAHYVCPKDLHEAHDRWFRLQSRRREELRRQKMIEDINSNEEEFAANRQRFFGLQLQDGELTILPLKSVWQVYEEGVAMKHCVFENRYYSKQYSLLLSARVNGERMETVEVSLSELAVVQSRGRSNMLTPYHERIIDLVNRNMHLIASLDR